MTQELHVYTVKAAMGENTHLGCGLAESLGRTSASASCAESKDSRRIGFLVIAELGRLPEDTTR